MKSLKEIQGILKSHKSKLKSKYKVVKVGIFGSYVHGKQTKISDIDLLVKLAEPIGWEFIDLKEYLEKILGVKVDVVTINALKPQLKDIILNEVVYA
jgi:predicted nucleotidyltransferase